MHGARSPRASSSRAAPGGRGPGVARTGSDAAGRPGPSWAGEDFFQELVQLRRVRLARRRLHHLAYEEAKQLLLPSAIVRELAGVLCEHPGDRLLDRRGIRDL